jgi:phage terminase large subunit-like protein
LYVKGGERINYIEEYHNKIATGEIVAGKKIKKVYAHIVDNLNDVNSRYYFDEKEAEKAISFIETFCCIPKYKDGRQPFILELWQKALVSCLFGFKDRETEKRQYKELFLFVGRRNAKTIISAAIILYILLFSGEAAQEVYSVATDRQQSKIIWEYCKQMILTSELLKKYFKIRVNEIVVRNSFNKFVPLSKNSGSMDGLSPSVMALDELHAIKDRNLYDVVKGGMYSRAEPLTLIMSTGGYIEQDSIFDSKYQEYLSIIDGYEDGKYKDETVLPLLYELDSKAELSNESAWVKANPNLGVSKSIEMLRQEVQRARLNEKTLRDILVKQFNVRENARDSFFSFADIDNRATFDLNDFRGKYFLGGVDLSQTTDLTAATALIPYEGKLYAHQMYWIPKDTLQEHIDKDGVPYDVWITRGLLRTCEGRIINPSDVCSWFLELQNDYGLYAYQIGYDRYNAAYLVKELEENFGKSLCKPINQSFVGLSSYMFESKAYFKNGDVIYNDNPIFKWCLLNTLSVTDTSGNIKPYKNRNLTKRIDGYSSFLDAFVLYLDNKNDL